MDKGMILKIGGSVITDKSGDCAIDRARLSKVSRCISEHLNSPLILVHGAGSCGHPQAQRYRLKEGLMRENRAGIFFTHREVCRLNAHVVDALRAEGVEAVGIHPLDSVVTAGGEIAVMELRPIEAMIAEGIVPVLHGDVVMDLEKKVAILSGDRILVHIALALDIRRVGLATNVPGVMDGERVIRCIRPGMEEGMNIGGSDQIDVTGGMRGKVQELLKLAGSGIDAHIFHIDRLGEFMKGEEHGGTIVLGCSEAYGR